ncbi:uncharacterized protein LOC121978670 [Zingiber officinale]|uniref:PUM-HD domain-containing protein n=1 Tax=Zingiber officinale TaxID=94328 RepID=A0A8J5LSX7_ZINOF|nr:uncharacterized protein LOC121978670 [Zingiber officinale]XP_042386921.1 uncharacterized protein LOC121978670 [Zingiber officinale]XP_042386927.1 uncharacterized protein LOC121978670 [Zingiber officinale]XP_042386933.1 uncharacterized protein LOC121978670 [Zingiber officinale]KAG6533489.1 hypothetical protein ZIOFF_007361 [Zingiber officinale]
MEVGNTVQDYDDLDKLLREIPNATTVNLNDSLPVHSSALLGCQTNSAYQLKNPSSSSLCDLFNTSQAAKGNGKNSLDGNSLIKTPFSQDNSHNYYQTLGASVDQDTLILPDEQSLTLAFQDMSFKDAILGKLDNLHLEGHQVSVNHPLSLDANYSADLNNVSSGPELTEIPIIVPHSVPRAVHPPILESEDHTTFHTNLEPNIQDRAVGHTDPVFFKNNCHHPMNVLGDYTREWQDFPNCSSSMPVNPGIRSFSMPNVPIQGFEIPASQLQQQFCRDSSCSDNVHHQHLSQFMQFCNVEYERTYRSNLEFHHQCRDGHARRGANMGTWLLSSNELQPQFCMSLRHQAGQVNLDPCQNVNMAKGRYNQLNPLPRSGNLGRYHLNGYSGQYDSFMIPNRMKEPSRFLCNNSISSHGHGVLDRFGEQIFPEKFETKLHGGNSLRFSESGSNGCDQLTQPTDNTRRFSPNTKLSCIFQFDRALNLDLSRFQGSFLENSNQKMESSSPQFKSDSLNNLIGQIHLLAKDQNHCRSLQSIFDKGKREDFDKIFLALIDHVIDLMTDQFGNYFLQKLIEVCKEDQITHMIFKISQSDGELLRISCNQHGTRVVQKIVETMKNEEQYSMIVSALKPDFVSLIKNGNGSHVAQRCLEYLSPRFREFLFEPAVANCIELARDRQGCCVLQKCMTELDGEQKLRLISKLVAQARVLSEDPYGNYVVQFILGRGIPWATTKILDQLKGHFHRLSIQKYSSNVIERCLKYAGAERLADIIYELINDPRFVEIVQDRFGNFVVQSAYRECKGAIRAALSNAIIRLEPLLRVNPYGKKVLSSTCYGK